VSVAGERRPPLHREFANKIFLTVGVSKDVIGHYNSVFNLNLSQQEINDLIEYLKSL